MPPMLDERVLDRIKPVSRELLAGVAAGIDCVELTIGADAHLEIVPATHPVSPGLEAATGELVEAWTATDHPFPGMRYICRRDEDGWKTKLSTGTDA